MNTSLHQSIQEMEKDLFQGDLSDIIEVTYAYTQMGEYFLNRTLFEDFIGEKFSDNGLFLYQKTQQKLDQKIGEVQKYHHIFHNFDPSPEREILLGMLESVENILKMTQNSLPFEAQKAGFIDELSHEETLERVLKNEMFETELFGGNIKKNVQECSASLGFFHALFETKKQNLSSQEQEDFLKIFQKGMTEILVMYGTLEIPESTFFTPNSSVFGEVLIDAKTYKGIFERVFEIYDLSIPVIFEERSSIYDSEIALRFPNSPAYQSLMISRILSLIQHEIETHYLIARNNNHILGSFRGGKNLPREEGLAMVMEGVLVGKKIENFGSNGYLGEILFGEILSGTEFLSFLELIAKLKGEKNALGVFLRRKRNYPFFTPGVQHKDATYGRGVKKVIDWIFSGKDISLLYSAKVSFEDLPHIQHLREQKQLSGELPLFIAEMLLFLLIGNNWSREGFLEYFYEKYPFFQGISILEKFSPDQERKMFEIYEIFQTALAKKNG